MRQLMKIYMSGKLLEASEAKVNVLDHGLLYGDGVFEGIRVYEGNIFRLKEHLERLERSAKAILLKLPWSLAEIEKATVDTCRANGLKNGYIRLLVTRGEGSLGISPDSCKVPELIIIADQIKVHAGVENGIKIITSSQRQMPIDVFPAQVKSLNYVKNVVAKMEAARLGYPDALILNSQGYVAEAIVENVFIVKNGELLTPPASIGALEGITRAAVMDTAKALGLSVREALFGKFDVWTAQEVFLTGTAAEMVPVIEVDGRMIGDGKPGALTGKILTAFRELAKKEGTKI